MIDTIYIEDEIADHPRVQEICARFPTAHTVPCERYGEVFNRKAQNFRLQKRKPALILARKHDNWVLETPPSYGIGGTRNFYFSHMLNCLYDCRYCFLQGMYRSANYVLFVNYEDFFSAIETTANAEAQRGEQSYFFSGYDCDSLALEPVSLFTKAFLPEFARLPNAWLELRTKSTQIRQLLDQPPQERTVVAFTLTPDQLARALEHKAPPLAARLDALAKLQQQGWPIGLRFDPLLYVEDYRAHYQQLFEQVFERLDGDQIHSVSLGTMRMPQDFLRRVQRLYPSEPLFAAHYTNDAGLATYPAECREALMDFCSTTLRQFVPSARVFAC